MPKIQSNYWTFMVDITQWILLLKYSDLAVVWVKISRSKERLCWLIWTVLGFFSNILLGFWLLYIQISTQFDNFDYLLSLHSSQSQSIHRSWIKPLLRHFFFAWFHEVWHIVKCRMGVSAGTTLNQGKGEALIVEEGSLEIYCTEVWKYTALKLNLSKPTIHSGLKSGGQANWMSFAQWATSYQLLIGCIVLFMEGVEKIKKMFDDSPTNPF